MPGEQEWPTGLVGSTVGLKAFLLNHLRSGPDRG
jgi:hypothetical protein